MANNKHLTFDNRNTIESMLKHKTTFAKIAKAIDKDPSTISKEIRLHCYSKRTGGKYINYNACSLRSTCDKSRICRNCHSYRKYKLCRSCSMCNKFCKDFQPISCQKLTKPPYVCNACSFVIIAFLRRDSIPLNWPRNLIANHFLNRDQGFLYPNLKSNIWMSLSLPLSKSNNLLITFVLTIKTPLW